MRVMDVPNITEVKTSTCGLNIYAHATLECCDQQLHFIAAKAAGNPIFVGNRHQCDIWMEGCEFAVEKFNEANRRPLLPSSSSSRMASCTRT